MRAGCCGEVMRRAWPRSPPVSGRVWSSTPLSPRQVASTPNIRVELTMASWRCRAEAGGTPSVSSDNRLEPPLCSPRSGCTSSGVIYNFPIEGGVVGANPLQLTILINHTGRPVALRKIKRHPLQMRAPVPSALFRSTVVSKELQPPLNQKHLPVKNPTPSAPAGDSVHKLLRSA